MIERASPCHQPAGDLEGFKIYGGILRSVVEAADPNLKLRSHISDRPIEWRDKRIDMLSACLPYFLGLAGKWADIPVLQNKRYAVKDLIEWLESDLRESLVFDREKLRFIVKSKGEERKP